MDEERAERQRFRDEEEAARWRNYEWLQDLRRSGFRKVGHLNWYVPMHTTLPSWPLGAAFSWRPRPPPVCTCT
jgi:hypothetical protein